MNLHISLKHGLGPLLGATALGLLVAAAGPGAGAAAVQADRPALAPSYEQAVLAARPVGYWRLGEAAGARTAADASGHQHHGTYHGRPHLGQPGALPGDKNTAVGLDGPQSKPYIEIPASKAFSVATSGRGLSVEVWLRPDALDFRGENKDTKNAYIHWLGKGAAGAYEWGFRFYNSHARRHNRISAYIWNPTGGEGAGAYFEDVVPQGKWLYVVATFDDPAKPNARVQIYRNGVPSPHNHSPGTLYRSYAIQPASGAAPVRLGTRDLRGFLTGGLDEVAIYPYVLSPEEIRRHWQSAAARRGSPRTCGQAAGGGNVPTDGLIPRCPAALTRLLPARGGSAGCSGSGPGPV